MSASDAPSVRKARGAFFTPPALCEFVAEWAISHAGAKVLEPSLGEAAFLIAAGDRLQRLGSAGPAQLAGVELHSQSVVEAERLLASRGHVADLRVGNFFAVPPSPVYDAVVGNPPYIRYQDFTGGDRALAKSAALRAGVKISNLASSWAAFTVHAALFLRNGGRLGLVLPGELLSVNYAAEVRAFLMRRFGRVRIVVFTERVFPGVLEEVVLLLAEGEGPTDHCELVQVRDIEDLTSQDTHATSRWTPRDAADKWTDALAPARAVATLQRLSGDDFTCLDTWGDSTLGMVTGNNRYFTLTQQRVKDLGLETSDVARLSPPGSRHLRSLALTMADWSRLGDLGKATYLFHPVSDLSRAARDYVSQGESLGVQRAYKCAIRRPWWRVPLLPPADLFLTYMNADTPRLCANASRVHHVNSVHGVYLRAGVKRLGSDLLPLSCLSSATAFSAELVGRSYGGGMLKLEPREADRLAVPSVHRVQEAAVGLRAIKGEVRRALALGITDAAVEMVDQVLLVEACGLTPAEVKDLQEGVGELRGRRLARGGSSRRIAP